MKCLIPLSKIIIKKPNKHKVSDKNKQSEDIFIHIHTSFCFLEISFLSSSPCLLIVERLEYFANRESIQVRNTSFRFWNPVWITATYPSKTFKRIKKTSTRYFMFCKTNCHYRLVSTTVGATFCRVNSVIKRTSNDSNLKMAHICFLFFVFLISVNEFKV